MPQRLNSAIHQLVSECSEASNSFKPFLLFVFWFEGLNLPDHTENLKLISSSPDDVDAQLNQDASLEEGRFYAGR